MKVSLITTNYNLKWSTMCAYTMRIGAFGAPPGALNASRTISMQFYNVNIPVRCTPKILYRFLRPYFSIFTTQPSVFGCLALSISGMLYVLCDTTVEGKYTYKFHSLQHRPTCMCASCTVVFRRSEEGDRTRGSERTIYGTRDPCICGTGHAHNGPLFVCSLHAPRVLPLAGLHRTPSSTPLPKLANSAGISFALNAQQFERPFNPCLRRSAGIQNKHTADYYNKIQQRTQSRQSLLFALFIGWLIQFY